MTESLQRFKKDNGAILQELRYFLRKFDVVDVSLLNDLLEDLAKKMDSEMVEGVLSMYQDLGVVPNQATFDSRLGIAFTLRRFSEVKSIFFEMSRQKLPPSTRALQLKVKTAIKQGLLDDAISGFKELLQAVAKQQSKGQNTLPVDGPQQDFSRVTPKADAAASASPAFRLDKECSSHTFFYSASNGSAATAHPTRGMLTSQTHLVSLLVDLACKEHQLPRLLDECSDNLELSTETVYTMLNESAHLKDYALVKRVQLLAEEQDVVFDDACYALLIKGQGNDINSVERVFNQIIQQSPRGRRCRGTQGPPVRACPGQTGQTHPRRGARGAGHPAQTA